MSAENTLQSEPDRGAILQRDRDLARKAAGGDESAWRRIYDDTCQPALYNDALAMRVADLHCAAELVGRSRPQHALCLGGRRIPVRRGTFAQAGCIDNAIRTKFVSKCLDDVGHKGSG